VAEEVADRVFGLAGLVPVARAEPFTAAVGWVAADGVALARGVTGVTGFEAVALGGWVRSAGAVAGPNVATESIAPATRQTAMMLASTGMMVPWLASGPASRLSRLRRRSARSSRW
jgi:hypothetical protein